MTHKSIDTCFIVCHHFCLPTDITKIIYDLFLNASVQLIIDKWKSYIAIDSGIFTTKKAYDLAVAFELELYDKSFYTQGRVPLEESYKININDVEEAVLNSFVQISILTL